MASVCSQLAAWLKAEGFRKKRSTFWKVHDTHSYQFAIQGQWFDSMDHATIDLPLGIVWHAAEKSRGKSGLTVPRPYWKCTGYEKLRTGRPSRQASWEVDRRTNLAKLAEEVRAVIAKDVFGWFAYGSALVGVLRANRLQTLERRKFFLKLLLHEGFGAVSLGRGGCSEDLLRDLALAAAQAGRPIRGIKKP